MFDLSHPDQQHPRQGLFASRPSSSSLSRRHQQLESAVRHRFGDGSDEDEDATPAGDSGNNSGDDQHSSLGAALIVEHNGVPQSIMSVVPSSGASDTSSSGAGISHSRPAHTGIVPPVPSHSPSFPPMQQQQQQPYRSSFGRGSGAYSSGSSLTAEPQLGRGSPATSLPPFADERRPRAYESDSYGRSSIYGGGGSGGGRPPRSDPRPILPSPAPSYFRSGASSYDAGDGSQQEGRAYSGPTQSGGAALYGTSMATSPALSFEGVPGPRDDRLMTASSSDGSQGGMSGYASAGAGRGAFLSSFRNSPLDTGKSIFSLPPPSMESSRPGSAHDRSRQLPRPPSGFPELTRQRSGTMLNSAAMSTSDSRSQTSGVELLTTSMGQGDALSFEDYGSYPGRDPGSMGTPTGGAAEVVRAGSSSGGDPYTGASGSDRPPRSPALSGQGLPAATRKQNSACDACRRRKVRCIRTDDDAQCVLCKSKGIKCTSIYVSQATVAPRKPTKPGKRAKLGHESSDSGEEMSARTSILLRFLFTKTGNLYSSIVEPSGSLPNDGSCAPWPTEEEARQSLLPFLPTPSSSIEATLMTSAARQELANDLIDTYFSIHHPRLPLLDPVTFRDRYFAGSLVDPGTGAGQSEPILAAVLLWGAKFSTHPIVVEDRRDCSDALRERREAREAKAAANKKKGGLSPAEEVEEALPNQLRQQGVSRIAEVIWMRTRELFESKRVLRHPTDDNIAALMIVSGYDTAWPRLPTWHNDGNGKSIVQTLCECYDGWYIKAALEHMRRLGYDRREVIERIEDPERKRRIATCWWIVMLIDAYTAALYRKQPEIKYDDYTTDPPFAISDSAIDAPNISGATSGQA